MCALFVGLPDVRVLGIFARRGQPFTVHAETRREQVGCPVRGVIAQVKHRPGVVLVDLPVYGRATRLVWHKRRWRCADPDCAKRSWTEEDSRIAAPRMTLTDRAGRWVTRQVGRCARSVARIGRFAAQNALLCEELDQKGCGHRTVGAGTDTPAGRSRPNLVTYSLKSRS
jgi:hypothetical protein